MGYTMRLMLKFTIPVDKGNQTAKDGTLGAAIDALIEQTNPEAAYFSLDGGERAGMIFFEVDDQARLTELNEPLFAAVDAAIHISPVLNLDDLRRGLSKASS
jgi:hypothetical protein